MRRVAFLILISLAAAPAWAQRLTLEVPGLADRAREVVEVTLDGSVLRLAAKFLSSSDPDERAARDIASKLEGVYVKSYEFDKEGEYDAAVVDRVRSQMGPTWKRIVTVKEKYRQTTEIYVNTRGEDVIGLCVINAEPRELTFVNIVGPIDLEKLAGLEGQFGIPRMSGERSRRGRHE